MLKTSSGIGGLAALIAGMMVMAACGGSSSSDSTENVVSTGKGLVKAAEKEGSVVYYAGLHDEASVAQIKVFQKKYPKVKVKLLLIGGEEQFSRVMQEHSAGLDVADLVAGGNLADFLVYQSEGMLAPYISTEYKDILPDYRDAKGFVYSPYVSRYVIAYNPTKIPEADAPKSWKDLGDPKWKGEIVTSTPATSSIAGITPFVLSQIYGGWDLLNQIGKNKPLLLASTNDVYPAVASGERPLAFVLAYEAVVQRENAGENIAPIFPAEGAIVVKPGMGIMKAAEHPNAARLLENFLLGQQAQDIFTKITGRSPTRTDVMPVPNTVPLGEEGVKTLEVDYAAYTKELADVAKMFDQAMSGH